VLLSSMLAERRIAGLEQNINEDKEIYVYIH
jgi:hypothetical protein